LAPVALHAGWVGGVQVVVGDPEVAEAAQAGAAVHQEVEQHSTFGGQDFLERVLGRVGLVDGPHEVRGDAWEPLGAAVVVVDHAGGRGRVGVDDVVGGKVVLRRVSLWWWSKTRCASGA
jgi:hypothetical protein